MWGEINETCTYKRKSKVDSVQPKRYTTTPRLHTSVAQTILHRPQSDHNTTSTTKLVVPISFLSILSLGSATNHRRGRLHLSKAQLEKV